MPNRTVLRVEVTNISTEQDQSQLNTNEKKSSSLTAGAVGGIVAGEDTLNGKYTTEVSGIGRGLTPSTRAKIRLDARAQMRQGLVRKFNPDESMFNTRGQAIRAGGKEYLANISGKSMVKGATGVATSAAAVYSVYSNYQKTGFELSGATHAAAVQGRRAEAANTAISIGVAALINPMLAAPMIAMKAYQLAQTNRKQIFEIKKSQIESQILQKNLVKNVAEKRF